MTMFTIDPENNITAFAHQQQAEAAAGGQSFASQDALETLTTSWPMDRFVTVWNSFAGVAGFGADLKPVKKFENRNKAVARIWKALQRLNGGATLEDAPAAETAATAPRALRASAQRASRGSPLLLRSHPKRQRPKLLGRRSAKAAHRERAARPPRS